MFESAGLRWMDKVNLICTKTNRFTMNLDHTLIEGMVIAIMVEWIEMSLRTLKNVGIETIWGDGKHWRFYKFVAVSSATNDNNFIKSKLTTVTDSASVTKPVELKFDIDHSIIKSISQGRSIAKAISDESDARYFNYSKFGKDKIKKLGKVGF